MHSLNDFQEHVGIKYQLYNGLFLNLPFAKLRSTGIMLPLFTEYAKEELSKGAHPKDIVHSFFKDKYGYKDDQEIVNELFRIMRLVERQVVLFDALEDAAFLHTHDLHGPGSIKDLLNRVENQELESSYTQFIQNYSVRVVLTAHPTQFYTDEVLSILTDLSKSLKHNDLRSIHELLLQMGQTRFKNREKPTPLEEAAGLMWILEHIMYQVVPEINKSLNNGRVSEIHDSSNHPSLMVSSTSGGSHRQLSNPMDSHGILELGFWPGGDRDGNPYVTADLTIQVGDMLRNSVIQLYLQDFLELKRRLTFSGVIDLVDLVEEKLKITLYPFSNRKDAKHLGSYCVEPDEGGYTNYQSFIDHLYQIRQIVLDQHGGLFLHLLDDFISKVQSFGFHFASLDIRQDSRIHTACIGQIIEYLQSNSTWSSEYNYELQEKEYLLELKDWLLTQSTEHLSRWSGDLATKLSTSENPVLADCILSIQAIQVIQSRNGEKGCHRYIISNTQRVENLLEVWVLAIFGGMNRQHLPIDIVPLFETIPDLYSADHIMNQLYSLPSYNKHLQQRGKRQPIMLGFSDGTKDGGYVTANWEIYKAKERLSTTTRDHGFRVEFFDGRGGPPARGGGNTHKFYRSLGPEIESSTIQLTVQGQTISSLYGTKESALYNLEQLVSAGIENKLFPSDHHTISVAERELIDSLSDKALEAYRGLKAHDRFVSYLTTMTPLLYYGKTNIGSRPAKRSSGTAMVFSDLRAIPFVGAWSQMKQNIPGFFGFGTAISRLIKDGKKPVLQKLYRESLFFRTLVENSMQSLSKAFFPLTKYHKKDPEFGEFWSLLEEESVRTTINLLKVSKQPRLLSTEPTVRDSIQLRESMILPSLVIQQYALSVLREGKADERYEKLVLKSLAASINASRNAV